MTKTTVIMVSYQRSQSRDQELMIFFLRSDPSGVPYLSEIVPPARQAGNMLETYTPQECSLPQSTSILKPD